MNGLFQIVLPLRSSYTIIQVIITTYRPFLILKIQKEKTVDFFERKKNKKKYTIERCQTPQAIFALHTTTSIHYILLLNFFVEQKKKKKTCDLIFDLKIKTSGAYPPRNYDPHSTPRPLQQATPLQATAMPTLFFPPMCHY